MRVHATLATLSEKVSGLQEHKLNKDARGDIDRDIQSSHFRTLQEVGGLVGNLRADVKDWFATSREEYALKQQNIEGKIQHLEARLMAAINEQNAKPWVMKNLGLIIAMVGLALAVLSGNPQWLRFGGLG